MTSPDASLRSLTRHEKYYIAGGDLTFLVENVHFRVHRYFFERESGYFVRKLVTPASPGDKPQGTQESNAILLEDVLAEDFATFLWVFYNPVYSLYDRTVSDWETILRLSVRWEFPEVKNLAVRELEKKEISDSKRIKLYHENNVDRNVLIPRYAALCEREAHLTLEEGLDIGMETVLMIAAGRQEARASKLATGGRSPVSPTIRGADLHEVVREIFKIDPEPSNKDTTVTTPTTNELNGKKTNGTNGTNPDDHKGRKLNGSNNNANGGKKDNKGK